MKDLLDYLAYLLARGVVAIFRGLPLKTAMDLGAALARVWFLIDKRHRLVTLNNLTAVFPEKLQFEINRIARSCFEEIGRTASITCRMPDLADRKKLKNLVSGEIASLEKAYRENRGVLMITGHFGAWELLTLYHQLFVPVRMSAVVRPLDNPYLNDLLVKYRSRNGAVGVIPKKKAAKEILKLLKKGENVGILIDQNVSADEGVFVDFLGIPASTTAAPAVLAARTGAAVIPAFIYRDGPGHYQLICGKELVMQDSGDKADDIRVNTQLMTDAVAKMVYKYPEQWLWMHRRWKTRPPE